MNEICRTHQRTAGHSAEVFGRPNGSESVRIKDCPKKLEFHLPLYQNLRGLLHKCLRGIEESDESRVLHSASFALDRDAAYSCGLVAFLGTRGCYLHIPSLLCILILPKQEYFGYNALRSR